jgi:alcohol dehydrogenase (cytochrome c)
VRRADARAALLALALGGAACVPAGAAGTEAYRPVTEARLRAAARDDGWLMYRRSWDAQAYAPHASINRANVGRLRLAFTYDTGMPQGHESVPIVNGRSMFVTTPFSRVVALDAVTGAVRWVYEPQLRSTALARVCCDMVNRGVALYGTNVYVGTLDSHLIALDARTGRVVWDRAVAPPSGGYAITGAPLVAAGLVMTGVAGGEFGANGFVAAFDARTGAPAWRRATIPASGAGWANGTTRHGGGSSWLTGSFDPATRTVFWGIGNPSPWLAQARPGPNPYTDSVLALDAATGRIKWWFQFTPHDSWDYDGVNEMVLVNVVRNGRRVRALLHADRNGYLFALDRDTGALLYARPYVKSTAVLGYDGRGRARIDPRAYPRYGRDAFACPSSAGGKNWYPVAYSPRDGAVYVPILHLCMRMHAVAVPSNTIERYLREDVTLVAEPNAPAIGEFAAIDAATGVKRWSLRSRYPWTGGVLATAGGLVFTAAADREFRALDAATGRTLWRYATRSAVVAPPSSYVAGGRQYIAIFAGWGGGLSVFGGPATTLTRSTPRGGRLYVFALPGASAPPNGP